MTSTSCILTRRATLAGIGAIGLLAACGPKGPGSVTLAISGQAGANPGPDGADRPVTLQILQLRGTAAFDAANPLALQYPAAALGPDLVKAEAVTLAPGGSAAKTLVLDPTTAAIAVVAGFRSPSGKAVRAKAAVNPTAKAAFNITVGPGGVTMAPA